MPDPKSGAKNVQNKLELNYLPESKDDNRGHVKRIQ